MNKLRYLIESVNLLFEYRDELSALNTLLALWRRAKSPAERESAESLYKKTLAKISAEYGEQTANQMDQYVSSGKADEDDSRLKPAKRDGAGNITIPAQTLKWPPTASYSAHSRQGPTSSSSQQSNTQKIWPYRTFEEFWTSPVRSENKVQLDDAPTWHTWTWTIGTKHNVRVFGFALQHNQETGKFKTQAIFYMSQGSGILPSAKSVQHKEIMNKVDSVISKTLRPSETEAKINPTSVKQHPEVYRTLLQEIEFIEETDKDSTSVGKWQILELARYKDSFAGVRGSDKIWGFATNGEYYRIFWGRYLGKLSTKDVADRGTAMQVYYSKLDKGYVRQDYDHPAYNYLRSIVSEWK